MTRDLGVWTYENSALVLIDYQNEMFETIRSETTAELAALNVRLLARTAKAFNMPLVLSCSSWMLLAGGHKRHIARRLNGWRTQALCRTPRSPSLPNSSAIGPHRLPTKRATSSIGISARFRSWAWRLV